MDIRNEFLIIFDRYIDIIGGKKYKTHQHVVDIYDKLIKTTNIASSDDINQQLLSYKNDLIYLAWRSLGEKSSFSNGVIRKLLFSLGGRNSLPLYIVNNTKVIRRKSLSGIKIGKNKLRNALIIRIGCEVTPDMSTNIFQESNQWIQSQLNLILLKSGFLNFEEWISCEASIQEFYPYGVASKPDYVHCLNRISHEITDSNVESKYGVCKDKLNNFISDKLDFYSALNIISLSAINQNLLSFRDRNKLYEIKNYLLCKLLDCNGAKIISVVKKNNPYLLNENNLLFSGDWAMLICDFFQNINYQRMENNIHLLEYFNHIRSRRCISYSIKKDSIIIKVHSKSLLLDESLEYLIGIKECYKVSFLKLIFMIFGVSFIRKLPLVQNLPKYLLDSFNDSCIIEEFTDDKYYWYYIIAGDKYFFYLPYSYYKLSHNYDSLDTDSEIEIKLLSSFTEIIYNDLTLIREYLYEALGKIMVQDYRNYFPNSLKKLEDIKYSWEEYKQLKFYEKCKYWDLYEQVIKDRS